MSIDQLHGYGHFQRMRQQNTRVYPRWSYEPRYHYPEHPRYRELLDNYEKACDNYESAFKTVKFVVEQRVKPDYKKTEEKDREFEKYKLREKEAVEAIGEASKALRAFQDQTPDERISLLQSEIDELQIQLEDAQKAEQNFTQKMIDDPNATRARLERILQGYSTQQAEYDPQQLAELRSLKSEVESLKSKIYNRQRDIYDINRLVEQEDKKAQLKAQIESVLPPFIEACNNFNKALEDLINAAIENKIQIYTGNVKIPKTAIFKEPTYSYENGNIYFEF